MPVARMAALAARCFRFFPSTVPGFAVKRQDARWLALLSGGLLALALCGRFEAGRGLYAVVWAVSFAALGLAAQKIVWPRRGLTVLLLLGLGLALRALFIWCWPADSDVNRYIVEGALQLAGGNPYALAPADPRVAAMLPEAVRSVLPGVNHAELSAAYPPLAELYCRLVSLLLPSALGFKLAAALADWLGCLGLAIWCWRRGGSLGPVLLMAANPLSLVMAAGEGHLDAAMVPLVLAAIAAFAAKRDAWGFVCLGAAGMIKYPLLVLAPFFMTGANAKKAVWTLAPLLLFGWYVGAGAGVFTSLAAFAAYVAHGGPVAAVLWPVFGRGAPLVSVGVGALLLTGLWLAMQDRRRGPLTALTVTLACLPTLYPWYFLPLVPLWAMRPNRAVWWLLAAQGVVTAPTWLRGSGLGGEGWALALVWLPYLVLAVRGWFRPGLLVPTGRAFGPVGALAVVIPTRNEADRLGGCLAALAPAVADGVVAEVVVADGGSEDATAAVALEHGARVVVGQGGRGGQLAAGIAACRAGAVLVIHADAVCRPDVPGRVLRALADAPCAAGGAVGMRFARAGFPLAVIGWLNALRARATGIAFGDQGQFFRREALDGAGGFPAMALMEDVELSLRLAAAGETLFLGGGVTVSPRRWAGEGFWSRTTDVLRLFFAYLAERRLGLADPAGARYFLRYYGRMPTTR